MRQTDEWIAKHDDEAIPTRVRLRIWERCGGRCAITGVKLRLGDGYEFDHIIALANGGQHRESNLQLVSTAAHKEKTRADRQTLSKTTRMALKDKGLWPKTKTPLRGRGFQKTRDLPVNERA